MNPTASEQATIAALKSAIRTFEPGVHGLTERECQDAVAKLKSALVGLEVDAERCPATPVGGYSSGWQCDLVKGHGTQHMALTISQTRLPDGQVQEATVPINWEQHL